MSTEQNKAILRRYIQEVDNKGNFAVHDELVAPNFRSYYASGPPMDREGHKQFLTVMRTACPDIRVTIEDLIAEGDKVVVRWTSRGTHQGEFQGVLPTAKQVTVTGITINRFADGQLVETWSVFDQMGLLQQLGVVPSPGQA